MKSSVVSVDKNLKEQISHGNYAFPVDVHCIDFQAEGKRRTFLLCLSLASRIRTDACPLWRYAVSGQ